MNKTLTLDQPSTTTSHGPATGKPSPEATQGVQRKILAALRKRSFLTLATVSPKGRSHVAGVVYEWVAPNSGRDGALWIHLSANSRKARNIAASPHAAVTIPFHTFPLRVVPVGPPNTIHFQCAVELIAMDSAEATALLNAGKLRSISGHGALDMPDGVFCKITPVGWIHSFGIGVRMIDLIRDPIGRGGRRFRYGSSVTS